MNATASKEYRLARHYLDQLRLAHQAFKSGTEMLSYGVQLLEMDWAQIKHWHDWAIQQSTQNTEIAELCSAYPFAGGELLTIVLTPHEHREWLEKAIITARAISDHRAEIAHLLALSEICEKLDQYERATECANQVLALARLSKNKQSQAHALYLLGLIELRLGNYANAQDYFEKSLSIYDHLGQPEGLAINYMGLSSIYSMRGDRPRVEQFYKEILDIRRQLDDQPGIAEALNLISEHWLSQDLTSEAQPYLQEALRIRREIGDLRGIASVLSNLGRMAVLEGDFQAGMRYFEESLEISGKIGSRKAVSSNLLSLAGTSILQGDFEKANRYANQALLESRQIRNRVGVINSLVYVAYSQLGLGDQVGARISLVEGLQTIQESDITFLLPEVVLGIAMLRSANGEAERGAVLAGAVEVFPTTHPVTKRFILPFVKSQLKTSLSADVYTAARDRGKLLNLQNLADELLHQLSSE